MYHNQTCTPSGVNYARQAARHPFAQLISRAPVNIYKTENSYELMVFAPGRVKENFKISIAANELVISYQPPQGKSPDWIQREYSRGFFERRFVLDETIDNADIKAVYVNGVLEISLPIIPGKKTPSHEVPVN